MTTKDENSKKMGYACAYTPLALIDAAGYTPYRILPMSDLHGAVFMNSCDAMRRLADAWKRVRPADSIILLDLPATADDAAVAYFAGELARLTESLSEWSGRNITNSDIETSIEQYNQLPPLFNRLRERLRQGVLAGGSTRMQTFYNEAMMAPFEKSARSLKRRLLKKAHEA
jgi:benzoyl-CoA reductase/2-hydroxyglutaryl-CoA dehydratase subunit BcrC/BadD/HgdB